MSGKLAVVFAEDMYECLELHYPRLRLVEAGYKVEVLGPNPGQTYKSKEGYWAVSSKTELKDIDPGSVSIVVVPGGFMTDRLRRYPAFCDWLHAAWNNGNGATVGFICHGAWLPISANIIKGMKVTCFFAIKDDLINAGANYVDEKCVTDGKMVTAQTPEDLPAFMAAIFAIENTRSGETKHANRTAQAHQTCACLGKCFYFGKDGVNTCCVTVPGPSRQTHLGLYPCAKCVQGRAAAYIALEESGATGITEEMKQGLVPHKKGDHAAPARCACGNFASGGADGLCNACRNTGK